MRKICFKNYRTFAVVSLCTVLGAAILTDTILSKKSDFMVPPVRVATEDFNRRASELLRNMETGTFAVVSKKVFDFLKSDAPYDLKQKIVDDFCKKYGKDALGCITTKISIDFGMNYDSPNSLKEPDKKSELSYMQALARGLYNFGFDGFKVAVDITASQDFLAMMVQPTQPPLSATLCLMTCVSLKRDKKIDLDKAVDYIIEEYLKRCQEYTLSEKAVKKERIRLSENAINSLLNIIAVIRPSALSQLFDDKGFSFAFRDFVRVIINKSVPNK